MNFCICGGNLWHVELFWEESTVSNTLSALVLGVYDLWHL